MSEIIITMAGRGERFYKAGYTVPKYAIETHGKTLFEWAMLSLSHFFSESNHFTFITQADYEASDFIAEKCHELGINSFDVVELSQVTDGQATTVMLAEPCIQNKESNLFIYNIDTHVSAQHLLPQDYKGAGWIPCFAGEGDHWSFVKTDDTLRAIEVREKKRVSPHATIGLYGFQTFSIYKDAYNRYYHNGQNNEANERYIAPLYNQLIDDAQDVYVHVIPKEAVYPMGTPQEITDLPGQID